MVNYKLGIYNRKEGRIVDLSKITNLKDLKKLDELTCSFNSEEELKVYLFNQGLISSEEIKQNVSVMYKNRGKVKKLPIIYQDMKKYLDIIHLRYELKGLCSDIEFLEKLARHYSLGSDTFNPQGLNVQDIRIYLSDVRSNGGKIYYSKILETAIEDLYKKAIVKSIDENGEVIQNYRGLRDLAIFIYKHKKDLDKKDVKQTQSNNESWVQTSVFDIKNDINQNTDFEKKISFDCEWDFNDEPDFPPNSEEEANYKRYLEELEEKSIQPIEKHDHYRR